jgi:hypothetical protein
VRSMIIFMRSAGYKAPASCAARQAKKLCSSHYLLRKGECCPRPCRRRLRGGRRGELRRQALSGWHDRLTHHDVVIDLQSQDAPGALPVKCERPYAYLRCASGKADVFAGKP